MSDEAQPANSTTRPPDLPSARRLLALWAGIGLQSFGGGASTTLLIQRTFIQRYSWITVDEFNRMWNLCQLTPGINLIALTALIGRRLAGWRGVVASLVGMLIPSASVTCLLAALFAEFEGSQTVEAIVRGVVPATGGIMALVAFNFARPLFHRSAAARIALTLALAAICSVAVIVYNVSAILIVIGCAVLGAFIFAPRSPTDGAVPGISTAEEETVAK